MRGARDWLDATAPTLADIELIAADAWDRVPAEFRQLCRDIVFRVEDFADDAVLDELGIEDAFELMGLYKGVSLDRKSTMEQSVEPDMVFLYRRPLLDYWSDGEETLGNLVTHVLIHEVGHHFGLSDADMEQIESDTRET
ncbi:MAG: metallopeptidase family protein [Hyphomicrobiaceae bacterium]